MSVWKAVALLQNPSEQQVCFFVIPFNLIFFNILKYLDDSERFKSSTSRVPDSHEVFVETNQPGVSKEGLNARELKQYETPSTSVTGYQKKF